MGINQAEPETKPKARCLTHVGFTLTGLEHTYLTSGTSGTPEAAE